MLGEELVDPGPLCPSGRALCDRTMLGRIPNILFFLVMIFGIMPRNSSNASLLCK
jgi:hypothetical protein